MHKRHLDAPLPPKLDEPDIPLELIDLVRKICEEGSCGEGGRKHEVEQLGGEVLPWAWVLEDDERDREGRELILAT